MKLTTYLRPEYVEIGITAASKDELISKMVDIAARNPSVLDKQKVAVAISERERIMSTGVGKGFAIPHGKSDAVSNIVLAFGITAEPIDYSSMDNEPVRLVLLLVSRENDVGLRLKLLSRASKVMNSDLARTALLNAKSSEEVMEIIRAEEDKIGD